MDDVLRRGAGSLGFDFLTMGELDRRRGFAGCSAVDGRRTRRAREDDVVAAVAALAINSCISSYTDICGTGVVDIDRVRFGSFLTTGVFFLEDVGLTAISVDLD